MYRNSFTSTGLTSYRNSSAKYRIPLAVGTALQVRTPPAKGIIPPGTGLYQLQEQLYKYRTRPCSYGNSSTKCRPPPAIGTVPPGTALYQLQEQFHQVQHSTSYRNSSTSTKIHRLQKTGPPVRDLQATGTVPPIKDATSYRNSSASFVLDSTATGTDPPGTGLHQLQEQLQYRAPDPSYRNNSTNFWTKVNKLYDELYVYSKLRGRF
jgi:hypothetical protein